MDADENRVFRSIGNPRTQLEGDENITVAGHLYVQSPGFEQRLEIFGDIEREIFFVAIRTDGAFVVTAMPGINDDGSELAEIRDHLWTELGLNRFREINSGNEIMAVLFDHRETEPVANAIDHYLPAVALEFEGVLPVLEPDALLRRSGPGSKAVKSGDVIDRQEIAAMDLDQLPIRPGFSGGGETGEGDEDNKDEGSGPLGEH